ncbi:unnamed protein product [Calicophoron daubneyi]|uniref:BPL/LPL catalytic domain-containing protein n=1 Tax=Calicophoron daubneyi TaxID=300641 RepID=A0AAV2TGS1_CALDB
MMLARNGRTGLSMNSWRNVCATQFGRGVLSLMSKAPFVAKVQRDRSLLNMYYLTPVRILDDQTASCYRKCVQQTEKLAGSHATLVYPLSYKEFVAELWQTSAKLLILCDSGESQNGVNCFATEYDLVTRFLAEGGRVLMLMSPSAHSNFNPNSFGNLIGPLASAAESPELKLNGYSWQWSMPKSDDLDGPVCNQKNQTLPLLVGTGLNVSTSPVTEQCKLVIACLEAIGTRSEFLSLALHILGIHCDHSESDTSSDASVLDVSSNSPGSTELYSYVTAPGQQKTLDLVSTAVFPTANPVPALHICPTMDKLPSASFHWSDYFNTLRTHTLGQTLVWAESLTSSFEICEKFFNKLAPNSGLILVSDRQTKGKGRGANRWISPVGQAAFTFHVTLEKPDGFGPFMNLVTCMQHLVALSIVLGSEHLLLEHLGLLDKVSQRSMADPDLLLSFKRPGPRFRVKWPNDVYVVETESDETPPDSSFLSCPSGRIMGKLAGILTQGSMVDSDRVDCLVGCGVNVSNDLPTICLQSILDKVSSSPGSSKLTTAKVIASILNYLELTLHRILHTPRGLNWALDLYTRCWMHTGQEVQVYKKVNSKLSPSPTRCTVVGVDPYGYLLVRNQKTGAQFTLHPDGNSMDMMRGLIRPK